MTRHSETAAPRGLSGCQILLPELRHLTCKVAGKGALPKVVASGTEVTACG